MIRFIKAAISLTSHKKSTLIIICSEARYLRKMRLSPLFVLLSSWIILHVNADIHHEQDELSFIPSANHQDERDLQQPCPLGEAWDGHFGKCLAVSCDSPNACKFGETCTYVNRICQGNIACPQFRCDSPCPEYEQTDAITGQCVPISCSSPRACSADKFCYRTNDNNCNPAQTTCQNFMCCAEDTRKCASMYCAYGKVTLSDGCPICDCKSCWGYVGGGGSGRGNGRARLNLRNRRNRECPYGHEVDNKGCPLDSCRSQPW